MQDLVDEETQQIFEWVGAKKVPAAKVPVDGVLTTNDDETSVLSIELQAPPAPERPAAHTLLITVVDRSGSMSKFWAPQVVPALNSTAQIIWNNETTMTGHMLTYATEVTQLDLKTRASFQVRTYLFIVFGVHCMIYRLHHLPIHSSNILLSLFPCVRLR